jgi:hypothetical protein
MRNTKASAAAFDREPRRLRPIGQFVAERACHAIRFLNLQRTSSSQRSNAMRKDNWLKTGFVAAAMLALAPSAQAADDGVHVGMLQCRVQEGWGHVIASSRDMDCIFRPVDGGPERYTGELSRYGLDIGYTSDATLIWAVVAPTSDVGTGALEGDYGGASAQVTAGLGLGANVLIGGFDRSIALQPLSVEGNTGLALAAGAGVITLRQA